MWQQVNPNPGPAQPVPAVQPGLPAGAAYPAQPGSPANPVMPVAQPVQPAGPNNNPVPQPMTDTPAPVLPAAQPGQTAGGPPVANPCACADIPPDSQYTCQQQVCTCHSLRLWVCQPCKKNKLDFRGCGTLWSYVFLLQGCKQINQADQLL